MSSSDSSFSVVGISTELKTGGVYQCISKLTLLLLLSLGLSGGGTSGSTSSGGSGSGTSGTDVGQEILDVLTLEGLC